MSEITWASLVPLASASISFVGLLLVFVQLRRGSKQREAQSLVQILDINRQLLTLGFSHPDLFKVLHDEPGVDAQREEHYMQLWFNQLSLAHFFLKQAALDPEFKECLLADFGYILEGANFRRHWKERRIYYPASFQKVIDDLVKEKELPIARAALEPSED